jgi:hypothetical protein
MSKRRTAFVVAELDKLCTQPADTISRKFQVDEFIWNSRAPWTFAAAFYRYTGVCYPGLPLPALHRRFRSAKYRSSSAHMLDFSECGHWAPNFLLRQPLAMHRSFIAARCFSLAALLISIRASSSSRDCRGRPALDLRGLRRPRRTGSR